MYVLMLEHLERQVHADQQVIATLMAAGAEGLTMPNLYDREAELIELLNSPLDMAKPVDTEEAQLLRALGVGRG